jgi:hypothetical protein
MEATNLFESAITWLQHNYAAVPFYTERDIVWTVQTHLTREIARQQLPYRVFNDYPMLPGRRRALSADLVLLNQAGMVVVAAEFKYEPSHKRQDIWPGKFPVVFWGDAGVGKDIGRIHDFVALQKAQVAYALFIDEGGTVRQRPPHPGSAWRHWGTYDTPTLEVAVLWAQVATSAPTLPAQVDRELG